MFRRFWPAKWVYGNRRHWCNFKATINWLIWNDVELVGLQNCYLGFSLENFEKKCPFFLFETVSPPNQNFQKNVTYVRGSWISIWICLMNMCTKFQVDIFKKWLRYSIKHVKNKHFSRHFGTLPWFSEFCFLTDFDASKSLLGSFFVFFLRKSDLKTCSAALNNDFFVWPFSPGDLRWPWPVLWSQSTGNDTYRCQWHYPCRFIGFLCA